MNEILKTRIDIDQATKWLQDNKLIKSGISAKNWEAVQVLPLLKDGDLLDMGSSGGIILETAVLMGIKGRKVGIDLAYPKSVTTDTLELIHGDLMDCPIEDNSFDTVISLSVVEHQVDVNKFAKECNRLLRPGGTVIVSFDYWPEQLNTKGVWLYNLEWNILNKEDLIVLMWEFHNIGLELTSPFDWEVQDAVINPAYCSPVAGISYTFGILQFIKK